LKQLDELEKELATKADGYVTSIKLDESIAFLFGNGTTIGQVCSYAKGLESKKVETIPGFCCLDAPYEAQDWGQTVSFETVLHYFPLPFPVDPVFYKTVSLDIILFLLESLHVKSMCPILAQMHHQVQP